MVKVAKFKNPFSFFFLPKNVWKQVVLVQKEVL